MLGKLIEQGFGDEEDYNCAEKIVYGANQAYNLELDPSQLKLSAGFGGGMGIETTCGALAGGVMILSHFFVKERAHESNLIKTVSQEFFADYLREMGAIDCARLKEKYRTPETKCRNVIVAAAKALDRIIARHRKQA